MKTTLTIIALTTLSLSAQEIRNVGGRIVDLTAVQAWFNGRQGERPMKHWKQIHLTELKSPIATWDNCVVSIDDGTSKEILLAHCDAAVRNPISALAAADARIAELEAGTAEARGQLAQPAQRNALAVRRMHAGTVSQIGAMNSEYHSLTNQRAQVLVGQAQVAQQRPMLAMFTGQKYSGLEVWECGIKQ